MTKPRLLAAALVLLGLLATGCRPTVTDQVAQACVSRTSPAPVVKSGTFPSRYEEVLPTNGVIDARLATFVGSAANPAPIKLEGSTTGTCFVDGRIEDTRDFTTTPWSTWHDSYGMTIRHPQFTAVDLRVDNVGDGVAFTGGANDFRVVGTRMTRVHDDCIQNDSMRGGVIEDSYLECYGGVSARGYSGYEYNGSGNTLTVKNTLMYAKSMPSTYLNNGLPGHIGWFKFSASNVGQGTPPLLNLENVTLRVDTAPLPNHELKLPPQYRDAANVWHDWPMTCTNVTIVWTGAGAYPGTVPACATVTTDIGVWNTAVGAYDTDHPDNM